MSGKTENSERGQVLLVGIMVMLVLLLAVLFLFDIHNVIRGKFKMETAQESAALTAAKWQKESLNLIGEINLIKLSSALLENDSLWRPPSLAESAADDRESILKKRIDLLTEMQTRISFVGPLIGFAAAQQAAKANGLAGSNGSFQRYLDQLGYSRRYLDVPVINNYRWYQPYVSMVQRIADAGIAVFPNARTSGNPTVIPSELGMQSLYDEIVMHAGEVFNQDKVYEQTSWHGRIYRFVKKYRQADYAGKWWEVDYSSSEFPRESEIFTLGLAYGQTDGEYREASYSDYLPELQSFAELQGVYGADALPLSILLCRYDRYWYPEFFQGRYNDYADHYGMWYDGGGALRKKIRKQYIFEGAAAYTEGAVRMDSINGFKFYNKDLKVGFQNLAATQRTIGSTRGHGENDTNDSNYRPGTFAKALGELKESRPPIDIPVVLPVFDTVSVMPTYMPQPYIFQVLRIGNTMLDRFLSWLSTEESLFDFQKPIPSGCEWLLLAMQTLTKGPEFRYHGFNPNWDSAAFDQAKSQDPQSLLGDTDYFYGKDSNPAGAGWLQQAQLFYLYESDDTSTRGKDAELLTDVADHINGGIARRVFLSKSSNSYYVIDSKNHVVTNDELDPTRTYAAAGGGGGGGNGFGGVNSNPDTIKGPPRL